ncbi:MAG: DUF5320 domain-containing protein [Dehalococcoidia bacterium]|nr:DUF5320 domain-containing protein [Dehalococcoidia bacterium]
MPGFDGTGPAGLGPMTGGGRGFCNPGSAGRWYGLGRGGGFGFRGGSPPWPFVGVGRGGLPRGAYPGVAGMPTSPDYPYYNNPSVMSYGGNPYAPQMTREQELDFLKTQTEAMKEQLEQIGARMKELETEE